MKNRTIPFGYQMTYGNILTSTQEADTVQRIFNLYINGLGYKTITVELNNGSVQYRPGVAWNQHMVKRVLEDRRYLGEQGYPTLISSNDFDMVANRKANIPQCKQRRREKQVQSVEHVLLPYTPTPKIRRMTNDINRALEKSPDPEIVRPMIFACAAEKYNSIGVSQNG